MPPSPRKRNAALSYVRALADSLSRRRLRKLPSLDWLACEAGVSSRTMLSALAILRDEGVLEARQGSGYYIRAEGHDAAADSRPASSPPLPTVSRRLAWRIEQAVREGVFTPGDRLPPAKVLCDRYGGSRPSVAKALRSLADAGILERFSRGYRVVLPGASASARNTIALVARGEPDGRLSYATRRTQHYLRLLEQECALASLRLQVCPVRKASDLSVQYSGAASSGLLGTIVWSVGLQSWLQPILEQLADGGGPIALLDESAGLPIRSDPRLRRLVRVFTIAHDRRDGAAVGTHLRRLGHREVAYLSTYPDTAWATNRYEGLRDALGPGGSVHLLQ
ncbi:MAG: GntR family transcriptional regulator, partial [Chitinivibrionales bacterium]|nr:GntR family transcriptional regulator [Chitinivibrionales bacterium]